MLYRERYSSVDRSWFGSFLRQLSRSREVPTRFTVGCQQHTEPCTQTESNVLEKVCYRIFWIFCFDHSTFTCMLLMMGLHGRTSSSTLNLWHISLLVVCHFLFDVNPLLHCLSVLFFVFSDFLYALNAFAGNLNHYSLHVYICLSIHWTLVCIHWYKVRM